MGLQYIRDTYGVPAKKGVRVEFRSGYRKMFGVIIGSTGGHLRVRWDNSKAISTLHPTWELRYLVDN